MGTDNAITAIPQRAWRVARSLVGTRFRLHGRCAEHGLDCVGLISLCYRNAGHDFIDPPGDYRLRDGSVDHINGILTSAGFSQLVDPSVELGDIALVELRPGRFHLLMIGEQSCIHAHAGLRRVVEAPYAAYAPMTNRWRLDDPISQ